MKSIVIACVLFAILFAAVDCRGRGGRGGRGGRRGGWMKWGDYRKQYSRTDEDIAKKFHDRYEQCMKEDEKAKETCPAYTNAVDVPNECLEKMKNSGSQTCRKFYMRRIQYGELLKKHKEIDAEKEKCKQDDPNVTEKCKTDVNGQPCYKAMATSAKESCQTVGKMQSSELKIRQDIDEML